MKPLGIGVLAVAIIGGLLFVFTQVPKKPAETSPAPEASVVSFLVTTIKNDVSLKEEENSEFVVIGTEHTALPGAVVRTSETGRSTIEAIDGSVTVVDRNSEVTVAAHTKEGTSMELHSGAAWSRVEKVFEQGEFYEVKTQHAVATVRGTEFGTVLDSGSSTIFLVEESNVSVFALDENGEKIITSEVLVSAGNKAIIGSEENIEVTEITDEDRNSEWYQYNVQRLYEEPEGFVAPSITPELVDLEPQIATQPEVVVPPLPPEVLPEVVVPTTTEEEPEITPEETNEISELPEPKLTDSFPQLIPLHHHEPTTVVLYGEYFDTVDRVSVGGSDVAFTVIDEDTIEFLSSELTAEGVFDLTVHAGAAASTLSDAIITGVPILVEVMPSEVVVGSQSFGTVTLRGEYFLDVSDVYVGGILVGSFDIVDFDAIQFSTDQLVGLAPGTYDIGVSDGTYDSEVNRGLTIIR